MMNTVLQKQGVVYSAPRDCQIKKTSWFTFNFEGGKHKVTMGEGYMLNKSQLHSREAERDPPYDNKFVPNGHQWARLTIKYSCR